MPDPAYLEDRYRTVLVEKLKEKQSELPTRSVASSTPSARNVINLMDALKRSLAEQKPPAKSAKTPTAKRAAATEMKPAAKSLKKPRSR